MGMGPKRLDGSSHLVSGLVHPIAGWFIVETIKMDDLGVMIWGYPTLGSIHMLVVLKPFSHVYT
jgi:predicted ATP-grasp superfamily ATP-dependent carboligase